MKRVTIYVDEVEWEGVKESAYQARKSAGAYLMSLHLGGVSLVDNPPVDTGGTPEPEIKVHRPKYTSKYKEQNPNEVCVECRKALKFCFCEV